MGVTCMLPLRVFSTSEATSCCGEAALRRLGAVHRDIERRVIHRLLDAQIDQAGHLPQAARACFAAISWLRCDVTPFDLDIDRRRDAEVQDLRDDIRRAESRTWRREIRARSCCRRMRW